MKYREIVGKDMVAEYIYLLIEQISENRGDISKIRAANQQLIELIGSSEASMQLDLLQKDQQAIKDDLDKIFDEIQDEN